MKKVLAATDFSENADSAVNYAAELALKMKAKLILLHAYHIPVMPSDAPMLPSDPEKLEKGSMAGLIKLQTRINNKYGDKLKTETVCACGFAVEVISRYARKSEIDIVVVGMQGGSYLKERFAGSNTTALIRNSAFPVLVINKENTFISPKKIVFATDYKGIKSKYGLSFLNDFAGMFRAHLYILNVVPELDRVPAREHAAEASKLGEHLNKVKHTFHYIENNSLVDGVNDFAKANQIDLIVMIPRKHSIIKEIFKESSTKQMTFHSHIPLLSLHE